MPIDDIGKMVNIGTLLAFVIVCIAVILLRRTDPDQARPFRTPWVPLVPILGVIFNGYMMYRLGWINWARLIIWLAIGLVVYFTYGRSTARCRGSNPEISFWSLVVSRWSLRLGVCRLLPPRAGLT